MNYLHRLRMKNLESYPIKFTNFRDKGYVSTKYFCDYIEETKKSVDLTTNGNNNYSGWLISK